MRWMPCYIVLSDGRLRAYRYTKPGKGLKALGPETGGRSS